MPQNALAEHLFLPERQTNALGTAGFVVSLLGLVASAGVLSPVGLVISLIALGRQPRGLATAGVVLGLLGTCMGAIIVILVIAFGLAVALSLGGLFLITQTEKIKLTGDMTQIAVLAEQYKQDHKGIAPPELTSLKLEPSTLMDPWGRPYRYLLIPEQPGYDIISNGVDGQPATDDDVSLSKLDRYWEKAVEDFKKRMEEFDRNPRHRHRAPSTSKPPGELQPPPAAEPETAPVP